MYFHLVLGVCVQDLKLVAGGLRAFLDDHAVGTCEERPKAEPSHTSCTETRWYIHIYFIFVCPMLFARGL